MKIIKVKYADWWKGFQPEKLHIHRILNKHFQVEFSDNPDYVIASVFGFEAKKYDCVRILYTGENRCPDFYYYDYGIGFEFLEFGDRYIRIPNFIMNPGYQAEIDAALKKHTAASEALRKKKSFCSFVVSNGNAAPIREKMFLELSKYKLVHSGGKFLNNIGLPDGLPRGMQNKCEFQSQHKFSIVFENASHPGYLTEKLLGGFAASTVPIYWGDPRARECFNEKAFIQVLDDNLEEAIERVKRADMDDELYLSYLQTPAFKDSEYREKKLNELEAFLVHIFSQPLEKAYRRNAVKPLF
ncbi:MAG: hypothetical protein HFI21_08760 [Lachnospiraceae bacterium]|nr:hypothetical protein [Lachnospiraceae bacterium]